MKETVVEFKLEYEDVPFKGISRTLVTRFKVLRYQTNEIILTLKTVGVKLWPYK